MKVDVISLAGKKTGQIELSDGIFGLKPRSDILQRVVRWQLARAQAGTHSAKQRSDIARTGKKVYKQKGTGGARHGSMRSGIYRGGGKSHGPVPRSHAHDLPKKFRILGLKHALSARAVDQKIIVLDDAVASEAKTKVLAGQLEKVAPGRILVVSGEAMDNNFMLASRNLPNVETLTVTGINVKSILKQPTLVLTKAAVEALEARLS